MRKGTKLKKCPKCSKKGLVRYNGMFFAGYGCRYCNHRFATDKWKIDGAKSRWIPFSKYPESSEEYKLAFNS